MEESSSREKGALDGVSGSQSLQDTILEEKRLVRKLDLYLIPLVMSLYLFSFLDR